MISDHLMHRRYRTGLSKKAFISFIDKAYKEGLRSKDIRKSTSLRYYMKDTIKEGYYGIIYRDYIVVFSSGSNVGITILNLPKKYIKISRKLFKSKKGEYNNANNRCNQVKRFSKE